MVNYSNGKIYKIVCDTTGLVYIGSTTKQYLSQRLDAHRGKYKSFKEGKSKYVLSSSKVLENNNYSIILLELVECKTKDELQARERFYIETINCVNKNIPLRTKKEYYEEHKDEVKEYKQEYYEAHKDKIKEQHKEYREAHKEQSKEYREAHKDEFNKKFDCECGGKYSNINRATHLKTKKHINYDVSNI